MHKRQCVWGQSKKQAIRSGLNAGLGVLGLCTRAIGGKGEEYAVQDWSTGTGTPVTPRTDSPRPRSDERDDPPRGRVLRVRWEPRGDRSGSLPLQPGTHPPQIFAPPLAVGQHLAAAPPHPFIQAAHQVPLLSNGGRDSPPGCRAS